MTAIPLIPDNAPFTAEQRAWLNGFFAGLFSTGEGTAAQPGAAAPARVAAEAEDFPWHDPTLDLAERLKLAEGRPLQRVLMAAMAQLDCGQCGYLCQTYAEALATGEEKDLTRCVPGGKATARKLKELLAGATLAAATSAGTGAEPPGRDQGRNRSAPARFLRSIRLNGEGSDKDTRHVVFHLNGRGLAYEVGDSFGVYAENCPDLVRAIIERLGVVADLPVVGPNGEERPLMEALTTVCDIIQPSDEAIELLATHATDSGEAARLKALASGAEDTALDNPDLLDLLVAFPSARPPTPGLIKALSLLKPRFYSIASSPKVHPEEVHLTVAAVRYEKRGRARKGVASTYLADRARPERDVPVFVQPAHGFRLPKDPETPIIMVGPGTGVAPFRAFLQERRAVGARGRNWLFFGDWRRATDFLYEAEWESYRRDGLLTRLDAAFSRDQAEKIYVQHRMRERALDIWCWLEDGAHLYVCGDAKRMARDVDAALHAIVAEQSGKGVEGTKAYIAGLARDGRYQRDVY